MQILHSSTASTFQKSKEFLYLIWINLTVTIKEIIEFVFIAVRYYSNWTFCKVDCALGWLYLFDNPFAISKKFMQEKGAEQIYVYGETPLTTWETIAKHCKISEKDTLIELGCGRGRVCFWSRLFLGCKVVGIEQIAPFVERAQAVAQRFKISNIEFRCEDFLKSNLSGATVIYIYGSCMQDQEIENLAKKISSLPMGTKVISVSYPLSDYSNSFELMNSFPAQFTWGTGDVYLQVVNKGS